MQTSTSNQIPDSGVKAGTGWLIHLLAWAVIIGMPLFVTRPGHQMVSVAEYLHFLLIAASFMAIFYIDYLVLIPKYLFNKKVGSFLVANIILIVAVFLAVFYMSKAFLPPPENTPEHPKPHTFWHTLRFFLGNACLYLLVVGASVAIKMTREWFRTEALRREAEKTKTEIELENLKSQLNPHFLFNTLNNIYSLIQIDQDKAQEAVHDLSGMLRYVLYESSNEKVPLRSDMKFMEDYISLMELRMPSNVTLTTSIPNEKNSSDRFLSQQIAPLLFISLVENAFKHGVSNGDPSFINVDIHEKGGHLVCDIKNSNFPKTDSDRSGSGIGIGNLKKRLDMIYPDKYNYTYGLEDGVYHASLDINLHETKNEEGK